MSDSAAAAAALGRDLNDVIIDDNVSSSYDNDNDNISDSNSIPPTTPNSFTLLSTPSLDGITLLELLEPSNLNINLKKRRDSTYKWVQNYYNEKKNKLNLNKLNINMSNDDLLKLKKILQIRIDKTYKAIDETQKNSKTEKIFFSLTVYTIFLFGILIGSHPQYVHIFYSFLFILLMPIRYLMYYKIGYGYFLVDLCYFVNFLLMIYIWIFPDSQMLYISCCSFSWGSLSFAVVTWKNKLVLHSIEKITSTFIHVTPAIIMYVITHQLPYDYKLIRFNGSVKLKQWDIFYGIINTSLLYFIWQLSYHYFITIRKAEKIKNGKMTSFEYLRKSFANKPIGKFVNSLPEPFPVVAFTLLQYLYQLVTMSLCPLLYKYKYFCSLFVSLIFLSATYNGAAYYVDYYGKKFEKEVLKLQREIEQLQRVRDENDLKDKEKNDNKDNNDDDKDDNNNKENDKHDDLNIENLKKLDNNDNSRQQTPVTVFEVLQ